MRLLPGIITAAAEMAERLLRLLARMTGGSRFVRLLTARVFAPGLTAIERFLDARAEAFSERSWV